MKPTLRGGYYTVTVVRDDGKYVTTAVHILIARTWLKNPDDLPVVNHRDGNKKNNSVRNLEYTTHSANSKHAHDTGLIETLKRPVIQLSLEKEFMREYPSITEAARQTGLSGGLIGNVCRGNRGTAGKCIWRFKSTVTPDVPVYSRLIHKVKAGEITGVYKTANKAAKSTGLSARRIYQKCNENTRLGKDNGWHYAFFKELGGVSKRLKIHEWVICSDFPSYRVSKKGLLYSMKMNKIIVGSWLDGYRATRLVDKTGKMRAVKIHRLVAATYLPNPDNLPFVNHIDANKSNNNVKNLEWCTESDNMTHAAKMGLLPTRKVEQVDKNGKLLKKFVSIADAARYHEVDISAIWAAIKREGRSCGYHWRYAS